MYMKYESFFNVRNLEPFYNLFQSVGAEPLFNLAALRVLFHVSQSATNSNVIRFFSSLYDRERMDRRGASFVEAKGHTINKLKKQLQIAQQELQLKGKTLTQVVIHTGRNM